ncbi:MAG: hypothetical protein VKJ02_00435 [Snowella sp.]|nr:hypothetical protein [Snowella sp.]
MSLLTPSLEQLVKEINTVNHAWKLAQDLFETGSPLANSLRDLKTSLQIRLLRCYAPKYVYLAEDTEAQSEEPLYGLCLLQPIANWKDAAHLPIRVAQERLSAQEINQFLNVEG